MKPFPLAGLMRLRNIELDSATGRLAGANRSLGDSRERRKLASSGLGAGETQPTDADSLMAIAASRAAARSELDGLLALEAEAEREAEQAREGYRQAKMRTVPLEKMAGRHRISEVAASLKAEQNALDETAGLRRAAPR